MRLATIFLLVMAATTASFAQTDRVVLSADAGSVQCELQVSTGFYQIHMIHIGTVPRRGVGFRALTPGCWPDGVWLGDVVPAPLFKLESSHGVGIFVSYPDCITAPGYLGYMNFYAPTPVQPCCTYPLTPHLSSGTGTVLVIHCDTSTHEPSVSGLVINPDASCGCSGPVPVATTTWGRIKSMYR
jgi:hypothetical protein